MEADHDLAMSWPLAASGGYIGRQGRSVECVPLGYRIWPWNFGYERKSFYPSDQREGEGGAFSNSRAVGYVWAWLVVTFEVWPVVDHNLTA